LREADVPVEELLDGLNQHVVLTACEELPSGHVAEGGQVQIGR
jgi:hypothetical protein